MSVDDDMTVKEAEEKSAGDTAAKIPDSQQPPKPVAEVVVAEETEKPALADSIVPGLKLCGVCKTGPPKYRCSRCELPYCSLVCDSIHKVTPHAPKPTPKTEPNPTPQTKGDAARLGTGAAAGRKRPFEALDDSQELKDLFKMYPRLASVLLKVDAATYITQTNGHHDGAQNKRSKPLNQDPGLQNGLKALYTARGADGEDGEGVREYGKLVLQILAKDEDVDAAVLVQKELEEESARFVALLLQAES